MPKPPIPARAQPFHQAGGHQPIYHRRQILPADHEKGDQFLDRQARFPAGWAGQRPHHRPLLGGGAKACHSPRAGFVHKVRGLIKPEKKPVRDIKPRCLILSPGGDVFGCQNFFHQ